MKVTDSVLKLDCTKGSYVYAVIDDGVTLIDTSLPKSGDAILKELSSYGIKPCDIKRILLTHDDVDHIGNAAYLQEKCGCDILISEIDYPCMIGTKKRYGIKKVMSAITKTEKPKSVKIIDCDSIGKIEVISTPGHTPGHTCFRYKDVIFGGDLFSTKNGKLTLLPFYMNWNKKAQINSIKKLSVEGVRYLCPAHGEFVSAGETWENFRNSFVPFNT